MSVTAAFGMPVGCFGSCTPDATTTMRAGALASSRCEQQVGEQEVAEMVDREGQLVAVRRDAARPAALQPGVADQRAQRQVARVDLPDQLAHRRIEPRSSASSETAALPVSAAMRRTAACRGARSRLAMTTCQPFRASSRAHSKPMPEFPPVTRTALRLIASSCCPTQYTHHERRDSVLLPPGSVRAGRVRPARMPRTQPPRRAGRRCRRSCAGRAGGPVARGVGRRSAGRRPERDRRRTRLRAARHAARDRRGGVGVESGGAWRSRSSG